MLEKLLERPIAETIRDVFLVCARLLFLVRICARSALNCARGFCTQNPKVHVKCPKLALKPSKTLLAPHWQQSSPEHQCRWQQSSDDGHGDSEDQDKSEEADDAADDDADTDNAGNGNDNDDDDVVYDGDDDDGHGYDDVRGTSWHDDSSM